ncbi:MAG: Na+/H+ antiporter subunit E [Methanobacteriota archaeon]
MRQDKKIHKRDIVVLVSALFIFWVLLTSDFSYFSLILGICVSISIGLVSTKFVITDVKGRRKTFKEYFFAIEHLVGIVTTTIFRIIIANGQLIYQAVTLKIYPKIVRVKVNLRSDVELTILSHLITLTPGTLVIDIQDAEDGGSYLYVHFSYLKAKHLGKYIENTIGQWDKMIGALFK